jgi:predicted DCC family thiol-disulfide oxidoreductase YuxK
MDTTRLTILYDERCRFCRRCRDWLATQPCLVAVELLGAGSASARERYGDLTEVTDLVVIDDGGQVWTGPDAFVVCLWATARYRSWSYRLSQPGYARHAERFFRHVSKRRGAWGSRLPEDGEEECVSCDDLGLRWEEASERPWLRAGE